MNTNTNRRISAFPAIESMIRSMTISHLYSLDIRKIIGEHGIKKICNPIGLFKEIFNNPDEFNEIFTGSNIIFAGYGIAEYIYYGKINVSRKMDGCILMRVASSSEYEEIDAYLQEWEDISIDLDYQQYMRRYTLLSGIKIDILSSNDATSLSRINDMPTISYRAIHLHHLLHIPDEEWDKESLENIELGIPDPNIYRLLYGGDPMVKLNIPVYTHDRRKEYLASVAFIDERATPTSRSEFICYGMIILRCGYIDDVVYPASKTTPFIKHQEYMHSIRPSSER